jgi:hypothetical protein
LSRTIIRVGGNGKVIERRTLNIAFQLKSNHQSIHWFNPFLPQSFRTITRKFFQSAQFGSRSRKATARAAPAAPQFRA